MSAASFSRSSTRSEIGPTSHGSSMWSSVARRSASRGSAWRSSGATRTSIAARSTTRCRPEVGRSQPAPTMSKRSAARSVADVVNSVSARVLCDHGYGQRGTHPEASPPLGRREAGSGPVKGFSRGTIVAHTRGALIPARRSRSPSTIRPAAAAADPKQSRATSVKPPARRAPRRTRRRTTPCVEVGQ